MNLDENMVITQLIASNGDYQKSKAISGAVLNLLLDEIKTKKSIEIDEDLTDDLTKQAIEYISKKLTENFTIESIAKHLNVSPSTLMRSFKKNMNTPIHKYIIKKRLILAHNKISNGEPATVAAIDCGFNDYSGFYIQYKKMFGISPSKRTILK